MGLNYFFPPQRPLSSCCWSFRMVLTGMSPRLQMSKHIMMQFVGDCSFSCHSKVSRASTGKLFCWIVPRWARSAQNDYFFSIFYTTFPPRSSLHVNPEQRSPMLAARGCRMSLGAGWSVVGVNWEGDWCRSQWGAGWTRGGKGNSSCCTC